MTGTAHRWARCDQRWSRADCTTWVPLLILPVRTRAAPLFICPYVARNTLETVTHNTLTCHPMLTCSSLSHGQLNADDYSPIKGPDGSVLGYSILRSGGPKQPANGTQSDGSTLLELTVALTEASGLYFALPEGGAASGNVETAITTFMPQDCPFSERLTAVVVCSGRRVGGSGRSRCKRLWEEAGVVGGRRLWGGDGYSSRHGDTLLEQLSTSAGHYAQRVGLEELEKRLA